MEAAQARFNGARLMGMDAGFKLDWFKRAGRVLSIDQERTALGKSIDRDIWRIATGDAGDDTVNDERWTSDPRAILIDLAVKAALPGPGDDQFKPVQEAYAKICAPRRIVGAARKDVNKLDIRFSDGKNEYGYDGVSSGEAMVLLFLIKMTSEHIHSSIVLVDELELHQQPCVAASAPPYAPPDGRIEPDHRHHALRLPARRHASRDRSQRKLTVPDD
jgi:hypothetical protein